jgi:hypothetical protein
VSSGTKSTHNSQTTSAAGVTHQHAAASQPLARATPKPAATPAAQPYANEVVISLTASQSCWVQLTTATGAQIYEGIVNAGNSMHWTEKQAVSLRLGNPGGVSLTVNGKNKAPGTSHQPVTLSLGPGQNGES